MDEADRIIAQEVLRSVATWEPYKIPGTPLVGGYADPHQGLMGTTMVPEAYREGYKWAGLQSMIQTYFTELKIHGASVRVSRDTWVLRVEIINGVYADKSDLIREAIEKNEPVAIAAPQEGGWYSGMSASDKKEIDQISADKWRK